MNDKKFIEELKLKREEYGVSQKRLAVACGISREHYNRIETGKLSFDRRTESGNSKAVGTIKSIRAYVHTG